MKIALLKTILLMAVTVFILTACNKLSKTKDLCAKHPMLSENLGAESQEKPVVNKSDNVALMSYSEMLYVKINNYSSLPSNELKNYVVNSFKKYEYFDEIITKPHVFHVNSEIKESFEYSDKIWYSTTDTFSVQRLRQTYKNHGKFLIAEINLREVPLYKSLECDISGHKFITIFDIKIILPETEQVIFNIEYSKTNDDEINMNFTQLVFKATRDWIANNQ